jgi:hypothetical protein
MENPSKTGTAWVTPSPESRTIPVVRPDEYLAHQPGIRPRATGRAKGAGIIHEKYAQTENRLDRSEERWDVERLEKDLCSYISILTGIQRCLGEQDGMLFAQLVSILPQIAKDWLAHLFTQCFEAFCVHPAPYPLHVVPIRHYAVFHGILYFEQTP